MDRLRRDFQRTRNSLKDEVGSATSDLTGKRAVLGQRMTEVSEIGVLDAIRERAATAGVQPPSTLSEALDPHWAQTVKPAESQDQLGVVLRAALSELGTLKDQMFVLAPIVAWNRFVDEGQQANHLRLGLHRAADSLLQAGYSDSGSCPLCGQPIDLDRLAKRIAAELQELKGAALALEAAQGSAGQFVNDLRAFHQRRFNIVGRAAERGVTLADLPTSPAETLTGQIESATAMDPTTVEEYREKLNTWDAEASKTLDGAIPSATTARDQALVDLGVLLAATTAWRSAIHRKREAAAAFELADRVFTRYQQRQNEHLTNIIEQISQRMAVIWQALHPEEGTAAVAVETVGEKAAEISVEFHGQKESPPHRVLSESHLNSLGIALFLAMAETFNEQLGFIVLDDVVSSFDRAHRGRLAELLTAEFENVQLIVLTHDEQFYRQICVMAPSWMRHHFTSWSFKEGMRTKTYEGDRVLAEARDAFACDDRMGAAQKGRRALEEFLQEACEELEALLPFRRGVSNDERSAKEVLDGFQRTLKDRAKQLRDEITPLLRKLEADLQSVLNVEAHASQVAASSEEVRDSIARIDALCRHFTCQDCGTRSWYKGTPTSSQCRCGKLRFPPLPSS